VPEDQAQFRALVARVLSSVLGDRRHRAWALRRGGGRDQQLPTRLSSEDVREETAAGPDRVAERDELREWMERALEYLEPDDRRLVELRNHDGLRFGEIAERLALQSSHAARMRFNRALAKLASRAARLRTALDPLTG